VSFFRIYFVLFSKCRALSRKYRFLFSMYRALLRYTYRKKAPEYEGFFPEFVHLFSEYIGLSSEIVVGLSGGSYTKTTFGASRNVWMQHGCNTAEQALNPKP